MYSQEYICTRVETNKIRITIRLDKESKIKDQLISKMPEFIHGPNEM